MSFNGSMNKVDEQSLSETQSDSTTYDNSTVHCYQRRNQILSQTHHTEWWMAIAVMLIIASVGFVVL